MKKYYQKNWGKVVEESGINIYKGLLEYDCILRRETYGDNKLILPMGKGISFILKDRFNILNIVFYLCVITYFGFSDNNVFLIIGIISFLSNLLYGLYLGIQQKKDIDTLSNLNTADVTVLREGIERIVKSEELVKGDIVIVKPGSFISADLRIIKSDKLKVDERNITGEKVLKDKYETMMDYEVSDIGEINNMLFKGSTVKEGYGTAIVVETGNNTQLGRLLASLNERNLKKTNVIKNIDKLTCKIQIVMILISLIIYMVIPGSIKSKNMMFLNSIFMSTVLLNCMIEFIYSYKIYKDMAKEDISLTNLAVFNACNSIKVLFLNKYGTITEDKLVPNKVYCNGEQTGINFKTIKNVDIERMLEILLVNTNIHKELKGYTSDNFADGYVELANNYNLDIKKIATENRYKFRIGVDSAKSIVTTISKNRRGYRACSRGHIEAVLKKCTSILINGVEYPLTSEEVDRVKLADLCFAREGLISQAMAYRNFNYEPSEGENIESNMVFVGLIAMENPLQEDIEKDIDSLFGQGILPLVFCEDNKIAADIMGRKIGLISSSREVISGLELSYMSDKEFYKTISKTRIFCRLSPEQKNRIIEAFHKDGFNVAVEGENLNDLSNIAMATVGITKGKAPALLRKIGDYHTNSSAIKTLISIRKKRTAIANSIETAAYLYVQFLLGQIVTMYNFYFVDDKILYGNWAMITLNIAFIIPIILLALNIEMKVNKKELFVNMFIYLIIVSMSILPMENNCEFISYLVTSILMIITVKRYVSIKGENGKYNIGLLAISILISIIGAAIIYFTSSVALDGIIIAIVALFIVIYYILIVLVRKWQY